MSGLVILFVDWMVKLQVAGGMSVILGLSFDEGQVIMFSVI